MSTPHVRPHRRRPHPFDPSFSHMSFDAVAARSRPANRTTPRPHTSTGGPLTLRLFSPQRRPSSTMDAAAPPQRRRHGLREPLIGGIVAVVGSLAVLGAAASLNDAAPLKESTTTSAGVAFDAPPPPPRVKPPAPPPRPPPSAPPPPVSAPPRVGQALGGLDLGGSALNLGGAPDATALGAGKAVAMTEDTVDTPPKARARVAPTYPASARQRGLQGAVTLNLLIDTTGSVVRAVILDATPPGVFDDAALEAARAFTFDPARYQGEPVQTWARQTIRFELERP